MADHKVTYDFQWFCRLPLGTRNGEDLETGNGERHGLELKIGLEAGHRVEHELI